MPKRTAPTIEILKQQQAKITARIQQLEARNKSAERKKDLRRKILVGAYYLEQAMLNGTPNDLKERMGAYLTRNSDRGLFELPDIPEKDSTKKTKKIAAAN